MNVDSPSADNPMARGLDLEAPIRTFRGVLADYPQLDADAAKIEARVRELQPQLVAANVDMTRDGPERNFLKLSALLLACRNALRESRSSPEDIRTILEKTFIDGRRELMKPWLAFRFKIEQDKPHEAFQQISANFRSGGQRLYGKTFIYEQPVKTPERTEIHIKKCFFNDFFRRNDAPELTWLMCALDTVWAEELHSGPYNARFDRPTLLSRGDDACRFNFTRVEDGKDGMKNS